MAFDSQAFASGQSASGGGVMDMLGQQMAGLQVQNAGLQQQQVKQQMAMQQIALQRQQQYTSDVQSFAKNPTVNGLASLWKYPEFQANTKGIYDAMDPRMRQAEATQLGSFASVLQNAQQKDGSYNPTMLKQASELVQQRIDADKAAGRDTTGDEQALAMVQSGDPKQINAVKAMTAGLIAGAVGFDKAGEYLKAVGFSQEPVTTEPGKMVTNPLTGGVVASQPSNLSPQTLNEPGGGQQLVSFNPNPGASGGSVGTGATQAEGGGPASGGGAAASAGAPRSVRNNNPGNLKATPFTRNQPGYTGVDSAGYATFNSPESGQAAQAALLAGRGYYGGGRQTVASIVSKWAPSKSVGGDNDPAQTANYIKYVAKQLGVSPAQKLSPAQLPQLAQAMSQFERGTTGHAGSVRVPPNAAPQAQGGNQGGVSAQVGGATVIADTGSTGASVTKGAPTDMQWNATHTAVEPIPNGPADPHSYSPQEIDDLARNWIATGPTAFASLGGGMGGGGIAQLKKAALARATELMGQAGISADELPAIRSKYGALNSAMGQNTQILNMLEASEKALHPNAQQVLQRQQQLVQDGIIGNGSPWVNGKKLELYAQIGSAEVKQHIAQYETAVQGLSNEYTKFMNAANGMGGNAAPSDSARNLAMDLNDPGYGPVTMKGHISQIFTETGNKRGGIQAQNESIQNQLSHLLAPHAETAQHGSALPAGAKLIGTYKGRRVIEVNGQRLVEQ